MNMLTVTQRNTSRVAPVTAFNDLFGKYKKEIPSEVRRVQVREDKTLQQLADAWGKLEGSGMLWFSIIPGPYDKGYFQALRLIRKIDYTAEDVEKFSIALADFQDEAKFAQKAGRFLSALINNCSEKEFVIHTGHLTMPIDNLGYLNRKNITVEGSVGISVGSNMIKGIITVNGDAGTNTAFRMKGGEIIIRDDAGNGIGGAARGGIVEVQGECGSVEKLHGSLIIYNKENPRPPKEDSWLGAVKRLFHA